MAWLVIDIVMEASFVIDIILNFFVQYQDQDDRKPVKDLKKIAIRYITHRLSIDLIATFPWRLIFVHSWHPRHLRLLYLARLLRLLKLSTILDLQKFQTLLKGIYRANLNRTIHKNNNVRDDNREDNNKIMQ